MPRVSSISSKSSGGSKVNVSSSKGSSDPLLKTIQKAIAKHMSMSKSKAGKFHKATHKLAMKNTGKSKGHMQYHGKAAAKATHLGADFLLYGGKGDKIRRVVRGKPRPGVQLKSIRVSVNARPPAFRFGKVNATSMIRFTEETKKDSSDPNMGMMGHSFAGAPFSASEESTDLPKVLFVCCYTDNAQTVLQLEDIQSKEVLDTYIIEGFRGKPGIDYLQTIQDNKVVGVFGNQLIIIEIKNRKFVNPLFFEFSSISHMDVCKEINRIAIYFQDKHISIFEPEDDTLVEIEEINLAQYSIFDHVTSLKVMRGDKMILGLQNGRVVSLKKLGEQWFFHKEHYNHKQYINNVHSSYDNDILAINGDKQIVLLKNDKVGQVVNVSSKSNKVSLSNTKVIFMEFINDILIYGCGNGHLGIIDVLKTGGIM